MFFRARAINITTTTTRIIFRNYSAQRLNSLYQLTEEEQMFKDSVAKFSQEVVSPLVREMDEKELLDKGLLGQLFEQGLMGMETPEQFGGSGASFMAFVQVIEELAKVDPAVATTVDVHSLVTNMLNTYATTEQKEKYLKPLTFNSLGSFCLSEAGSGSDAFAMKTRAVLDGSHYILNGSKMWITNSYEAEIFLVFANVDPSKGYKGITCFIVEKDMGIQISKKEKKLGIKCSSTCLLNFDNVRVPKENVLGRVGQGYKYAISLLNEGRIGIGAQMVGLAQGALNTALPYTFQRKQFGQHIGDFQGIQFQMAQIQTEIEAARLLTYNAARLKETAQSFVMEAAMCKLYAGQIAKKASAISLEFMGGVGFTRDFTLEKFYRDAMVGQIYEGTSNIQLLTIAKLIKPKYS